jgi:hypothetical protein
LTLGDLPAFRKFELGCLEIYAPTNKVITYRSEKIAQKRRRPSYHHNKTRLWTISTIPNLGIFQCDSQFKQAPAKSCKAASNSSNTSETPVLTIARPTGQAPTACWSDWDSKSLTSYFKLNTYKSCSQKSSLRQRKVEPIILPCEIKDSWRTVLLQLRENVRKNTCEILIPVRMDWYYFINLNWRSQHCTNFTRRIRWPFEIFTCTKLHNREEITQNAEIESWIL